MRTSPPGEGWSLQARLQLHLHLGIGERRLAGT